MSSRSNSISQSQGIGFKLASLRSRRRQYPEDQYSATSVYHTESQVQGLTNASSAHSNFFSPSPHPVQTVPFSSSSSSSSSLGLLEPETMTCRDRTAEFTSVVRSLQSYHVSWQKDGPTHKCSQLRMPYVYFPSPLTLHPTHTHIHTHRLRPGL